MGDEVSVDEIGPRPYHVSNPRVPFSNLVPTEARLGAESLAPVSECNLPVSEAGPNYLQLLTSRMEVSRS